MTGKAALNTFNPLAGNQRAWTAGRVTLVQTVALLVPFIATIAFRGRTVALVFVVALAAAVFWEILFAVIRRKPPTAHGITTALIVAVFVPVTVPLWQVGLSVVMGVVLSELVFGGRGFGFLNPAAVVLALMSFSFPGIVFSGAELWIAVATVPGLALLLAAGLVSWRILVAGSATIVLIASLLGAPFLPIVAGSGLIFGLVFLASDPVGAASTDPGRWLYGILIGGLLAVFGDLSGPETLTNALVFAVLLASIFAPLLDHIVILSFAWLRERRGARSGG
jgi:Na+-transporting NADH:ubiquinone oxidoreductase subunit B